MRVTGFDVPAGGTAGIVFSAFVAPSAPGPDVCNQAEVTSVEIGTPVPTDDPSTATPGDPTCLVLDGGVVRFAVTKSMVDPNGPPANPGETLLFTIDIDNTGARNSLVAARPRQDTVRRTTQRLVCRRRSGDRAGPPSRAVATRPGSR